MHNSTKAASAVLGLDISLQILALGADTALLGAFAALGNCLTALILVLISRPGWHIVRGAAPVVLLLIGALLWAVWPDIAGVAGADRIAPDLVASNAAHVAGLIGMLVCSATIGARRDWVWSVAEAISAGGLVCLLAGLLSRIAYPATVWGVSKGLFINRYSGTMLNANAMGAVHAALSLVALGLFLAQLRGKVVGHIRWRSLRLVLFGGLALLQLGACAITGSRTAFAALFALSSTLVLVFLASYPSRNWPKWRVLIIPVFLIAVIAALSQSIGARTQTLADDLHTRLAMWRHYTEIAMHAGPHGYGLGSFAQVNLANLPDGELAGLLWPVNAAHNVVLQCIIEGGDIYAALIVLAVIWMALQMAMRMPRSQPLRLMQVALMAASAALLAVGLVDIALNIPAVATLASCLWGLAWGRALSGCVIVGQNPPRQSTSEDLRREPQSTLRRADLI